AQRLHRRQAIDVTLLPAHRLGADGRPPNPPPTPPPRPPLALQLADVRRTQPPRRQAEADQRQPAPRQQAAEALPAQHAHRPPPRPPATSAGWGRPTGWRWSTRPPTHQPATPPRMPPAYSPRAASRVCLPKTAARNVAAATPVAT